MTVQQLIDKLNQIPDKSLQVTRARTRADYYKDLLVIEDIVITTDSNNPSTTIVELRSVEDF